MKDPAIAMMNRIKEMNERDTNMLTMNVSTRMASVTRYTKNSVNCLLLSHAYR